LLLVRGRRAASAALRAAGRMISPKKARGVLAFELKPAHSLGDLLTQHLDEMEQEAENNGGVQRVLANHFAKAYKMLVPLPTAA